MTIKIERHEDAGDEMVAHYDIRPLHYAEMKRVACAGDDRVELEVKDEGK